MVGSPPTVVVATTKGGKKGKKSSCVGRKATKKHPHRGEAVKVPVGQARQVQKEAEQTEHIQKKPGTSAEKSPREGEAKTDNLIDQEIRQEESVKSAAVKVNGVQIDQANDEDIVDSVEEVGGNLHNHGHADKNPDDNLKVQNDSEGAQDAADEEMSIYNNDQTISPVKIPLTEEEEPSSLVEQIIQSYKEEEEKGLRRSDQGKAEDNAGKGRSGASTGSTMAEPIEVVMPYLSGK